ncbi:MAG: two-component system histidine kinase PnpS [Desulfotomaculales bacterium]
MRSRLNARILLSFLAIGIVFLCLAFAVSRDVIQFWLAAVLVLFTAFGLGLVISWSVNRTLGEVVETAQSLAHGVLDRKAGIYARDQVGRLAESLNVMAERLRQSLDAVTAEKNRMQVILDSMADGVIATDRSGAVILLNPVVAEIFDIDEESARGKSVLEVVRDYELDRLFREALASGEPVKKELRILTPEAKIFRVHFTPLKSPEGGVVALLRDITERRRLEMMRTEFVANASHELRTPLTSILGYVETLLDGAVDDPELARRFLGIINDEARRLTKLVDNLLDLARIEEKRTVFRRQPVDIRELVEKAVRMFEPQARAKGVTLAVEMPAGLPVVEGEPDLLGRVVVNLLDNAVKFTDRGSISVRGRTVENGVELEVEDTGPGIPAESLPRVFERFYRVDKARGRETGGTGIGLSIVKHIVEGHGGQVRVESELGKGTRFIVFLPGGHPS